MCNSKRKRTQIKNENGDTLKIDAKKLGEKILIKINTKDFCFTTLPKDSGGE